jgi:hypothetical protein
VKILQCPLDGSHDEQNLIHVFKEAYEILYTYMIGKSRKNALYFAKYIEFSKGHCNIFTKRSIICQENNNNNL